MVIKASCLPTTAGCEELGRNLVSGQKTPHSPTSVRWRSGYLSAAHPRLTRSSSVRTGRVEPTGNPVAITGLGKRARGFESAPRLLGLRQRASRALWGIAASAMDETSNPIASPTRFRNRARLVRNNSTCSTAPAITTLTETASECVSTRQSGSETPRRYPSAIRTFWTQIHRDFAEGERWGDFGRSRAFLTTPRGYPRWKCP